MPNIFATNGSMSDLCSLIVSDVEDTYANQTAMLNALIAAESDLATAYTGQFYLNETQYYVIRDIDSPEFKFYVGDPNLTDPIGLINIQDETQNFGPWADIDALETQISDACDCTALMQSLARTIDNTNDAAADIITKFTAANSSWISNAGANARETYHNIVDSLSCGDATSCSALTWLQNQYTNISGASANDETGEFSFSSTDFKVQGFAGHYAAQVIFQAATTVLSAVLTVITPIVGITVGIISGLANALLGLIPNASDSKVVEKDAANNLFAMPVIQDSRELNSTIIDILSTIAFRYNGSLTNLYDALLQYRIATLRFPGWCWSFYMDSNTLKYEAFISCDYMKYYPEYGEYSYRYWSNNNLDEAYKEKNPLLGKIGKSYWNMNPNNPYGMVSGPYSFNFMYTTYNNMIESMGSNGTGSLINDIDQALPANANAVAVEDVHTYVDRLVKSNIVWSMAQFLNPYEYWLHDGSSYSYNYPSGDEKIPDVSDNWETFAIYFNRKVYWTNKYFDDGLDDYDHLPTWENLVNKVLPRFRKKMIGQTAPLIYLMEALKVYSLNSSSQDYWAFIPGVIMAKKFRFYPPKYGNSARAATIAIVATAAVAVAAFAITKTALKITQRKKQISRYADVQNKFQEVQADPNNKAKVKAYRKAIRKYNRWCGICGTSKLSAISGWETGDSAAVIGQPTSISGCLSDYKEQIVDAQANNEDYGGLDDLIYNAIV